ncbi:hypothetical protein, partial [Nostoc sp. WHI]
TFLDLPFVFKQIPQICQYLYLIIVVNYFLVMPAVVTELALCGASCREVRAAPTPFPKKLIILCYVLNFKMAINTLFISK